MAQPKDTRRVQPHVGVDAAGFVSIGVIARAHGIRGALRFHPWNNDSEVMRTGLLISIEGRPHKVQGWASEILTLEGVGDRNQAEALQGKEVKVKRTDFKDAADIYLVDLVGAAVVDEADTSLGVVTGMSDNGAQVLLAVKGPDGVVLVPYVPAIVIEASRTRVVLRPPVGLFVDADALVSDDAADAENDLDPES